MRLTRIYSAEHIVETTCWLDKNASHHLLTVLRAKIDTPLVIFDGSSIEFSAKIIAIEKKLAQIEILEQQSVDRESPLSIHLVQALAKGEKMDFIIQKAVELGVKKITPVTTRRTDVRLDQKRQEKRIAHWQQVMIHASEQSGRTILPELNPIVSLDELLKTHQGQGFILHPVNGKTLNAQTIDQNVTILIGPEGGLDDSELTAATTQGFTPITLGKRVLRTETAALAAVSALQLLAGDFS